MGRLHQLVAINAIIANEFIVDAFPSQNRHNLFSRPNIQSSSHLFAIHVPSQVHQNVAVAKSTHNAPTVFENYKNTSPSGLSQSVLEWLRPPAAFAAESAKPSPPTAKEVDLLRTALGTLYGERNPTKAEPLLNEAITAWERQNADERAALYRVRADCYVELREPEKAVDDYTTTIKLLNSPGGDLADPTELPAAHLGRARAIRSSNQKPLSKAQATMSADDYETYLKLSARGDEDDFDSDMERIEDGCARNPYAAWEWGAALRAKGDYKKAFDAHTLASDDFDLIGDRARSVVAELDAAIDLAIIASSSPTESANVDAKDALESAIAKTTKVSGRDVKLLQRVIAKEGEARVALASILWDMPGEKAAAEAQLGESCVRLEQLDVDDQKRVQSKKGNGSEANSLVSRVSPGFSIDDTLGAGEISCSRFKNEKFLTESLGWPESLQSKTMKLEKLERK